MKTLYVHVEKNVGGVPGVWKRTIREKSDINIGREVARMNAYIIEADQYAGVFAAAPDLLEACKQAIKILDAEKEACGIYKANYELIQAAIAKAEH